MMNNRNKNILSSILGGGAFALFLTNTAFASKKNNEGTNMVPKDGNTVPIDGNTVPTDSNVVTNHADKATPDFWDSFIENITPENFNTLKNTVHDMQKNVEKLEKTFNAKTEVINAHDVTIMGLSLDTIIYILLALLVIVMLFSIYIWFVKAEKNKIICEISKKANSDEIMGYINNLQSKIKSLEKIEKKNEEDINRMEKKISFLENEINSSKKYFQNVDRVDTSLFNNDKFDVFRTDRNELSIKDKEKINKFKDDYNSYCAISQENPLDTFDKLKEKYYNSIQELGCINSWSVINSKAEPKFKITSTGDSSSKYFYVVLIKNNIYAALPIFKKHWDGLEIDNLLKLFYPDVNGIGNNKYLIDEVTEVALLEKKGIDNWKIYEDYKGQVSISRMK